MELFRLLGTIAINNEEANTAISETTGIAQKTGSTMTNVFGKIGNVAVKAGKVIASGIAVGSAAVGALTKASLDGYAEYEQLVGGVQTLFGAGGQSIEEYAAKVGKSVEEAKGEYDSLMRAQSTVFANADQAYKTAGLSANEYMETVTSFSASLLQSLGGDTEQAAEMANTAITDMADNANKMGTDMASIQNAYQGFAKQNYTMLDNLKLGYGGTATEMARLINDSGVLGDQMIDLGNKQGIGAALAEVGYAKMIEAIHVVQTEMGITGTTAKEASSTIQGSVSSMKSSWKNLIVGIADDNQDLGTLIDNFVDSASTAVGNLIPRIEKILGGIGELITKLTPIIVSKLPGIINALIPGIISGATSLMTALISALPQILQLLIEQIPSILSQIGTALTETFPLLLDVVQELFGQLVDYIFNDVMGTSMDMGSVFTTLGEAFMNVYNQILPLITQLANSIIPVILSVVQQLVPFIVQIVQTILPVFVGIMGQLMPFLTNIVNTILPIIVNLIGQLLPVITEIVQSILPAFSQILDLILPVLQSLIDLLIPIIQNFIDLMMPIINLITQAIQPLMDSIVNLIGTALSILQPILETLITTVGSVLTPIIEALSPIFETVITSLSPLMDLIGILIDNLLKPLVPLLEVVAEVVGTVLGGAFKALEPIITTIMDIFGGLIDFITGVFTGNWEMAWDGIVNIFKGIINLIPSAIEGIINGAIGLINGIIGGINKVTGWVGIPEIPKIPTVSLPKLEEGGVLEQGQVGILEGNGAEAVVPLEKNREWIGRVAEEMQVQGIGGSGKDTLTVLHDILAVLQSLKEDNTNLPDTLVDAIANGLTFNINNREFARLVKAV